MVSTFFLWTLFFVLQKPLFLLIYGGLASVIDVIWHGLPLDMSMAGYLTADKRLAHTWASVEESRQSDDGGCRRVVAHRSLGGIALVCFQHGPVWLLGIPS